MRDFAERGFMWCITLAAAAFVMATVGLNFEVLAWVHRQFLAGAGVGVLFVNRHAKLTHLGGL